MGEGREKRGAKERQKEMSIKKRCAKLVKYKQCKQYSAPGEWEKRGERREREGRRERKIEREGGRERDIRGSG